MPSKLATWWSTLNGVKKAFTALALVVIVGFSAGVALTDFRGLPIRVTTNEHAITAIQTTQTEISEKLDRMLCILQLEEDESALSCEGE